MEKQECFGVAPVRRGEFGWEILMVLHAKGHWALPKGHPEKGEEPQQTAIREIKEEVGLDILRFLPHPPFKETYCYIENGRSIEKSVLYFLAEVSGEAGLDYQEVVDVKWLQFKAAYSIASFEETKDLLHAIEEALYHLRKIMV